MAQVTKRQTARGETRYDVRTRLNGRVVTKTFRQRREAYAFAAVIEADRLRGTAVDPRRGRVTLEEWCRRWLVERPDLRPKTQEQYRYLLESYILPPLGKTTLGQLSVSTVRSWHAALYARRPAIAPKAYQVLRASLNTAVNDGLIAVNPCRIKGAGQTHPAERPIASMAEVEELAGAIDERFRLMVLLAYWCSLRIGELRALCRSDIDLLHGWIDVREQIVDVAGHLMAGPPKTAAGRRRVAIPPHIRPQVADHLDWLVPNKDGFVFTGLEGEGPLPSVTWGRVWTAARRATGLTHLRLHDLRHSGNTLAAATGASTRELMARMGHASPRAALIYQHATAERDQAIAAALSALAAEARTAAAGDPESDGGAVSGKRRAMDARWSPKKAERGPVDNPAETGPDQGEGTGGADGIRTRGLLVANQAL